MTDVPQIGIEHLTHDHLDALYSFLKERVQALLHAHPAGTEEHRGFLALDTAVDTTRDEVVGHLRYRLDDHQALVEWREAWHRLRQFAEPWSDDADYDTDRWPKAKYLILREPVEHFLPRGDEPTTQARA